MEPIDKPRKINKNFVIIVLVLVIFCVVLISIFINKKAKVEAPSNNQIDAPVDDLNSDSKSAVMDINDEEMDTYALQSEGESLIPIKRIAPGTSFVTEDGKVIDEMGVEKSNSAPAMSDAAPAPSNIVKPADLPASVLQINVSGGVFSPSSFTTKAGAPTSFSLTSNDQFAHPFSFDDPSLSGLFVIVGPGQTRAITFKAPEKTDEYTFRCLSPGHAENGEVGKMVVVK